MKHVSSRVELSVRDAATQPAQAGTMPAPSPYWDNEVIWDSKNNVHNPMFDAQGRVWITQRSVRPPTRITASRDRRIRLPSSFR